MILLANHSCVLTYMDLICFSSVLVRDFLKYKTSIIRIIGTVMIIIITTTAIIIEETFGADDSCVVFCMKSSVLDTSNKWTQSGDIFSLVLTEKKKNI